MLKYFVRFFIYLFLFTLLAGLIAGFLPNIVGQILTAVPYLIAMVMVLFRFIRVEQRAPTAQERNRFSLVFVIIFCLYNYLFAVLGPLVLNLNTPNIMQLWTEFVSNTEFQTLLISRLLIFMIPFYLITFWFYGKQAQRMADQILSQS